MAVFKKFRRMLRAVFLDDPALKLICLALAVLMWFYIDGELMGQKDFELTMRPSDVVLPENMELATPDSLPKFIVSVRGPRRQIEFWQRDNLRFNRPLVENPHPGKNLVTVLPSDVEAENFKVVSIVPKDPDGANLQVVSTASAMKPVRVRIRNQPKSEFLVGQPTIVPEQVRIKGAAEDLAQIGEVWTKEVDLTNAERDVVADAAIENSVTKEGKVLTFSCSEKVRVTVPITPVVIVRQQTFDVWARVPPGLALSVEPQSVQAELVIEERDFKVQDILSRVSLYVEWPSTWEHPKDASTVLGPLPVQVKFSAPPRVQVRGVNNTALPIVKVTGALAGGLK